MLFLVHPTRKQTPFRTVLTICIGMSDPDSQKEPTPPPQPPRRAQPPIGSTSTGLSQIEADAQYARQLAEHDGNYAVARGGSRNGRGNRGDVPVPQPRKDTGLKPNELYEDNHSFFDGRPYG